jgi:hypothetical protein
LTTGTLASTASGYGTLASSFGTIVVLTPKVYLNSSKYS